MPRLPRLRTTVLPAAALLLLVVIRPAAPAAPPDPPADFAQPQSSPRPAPFPVVMVDQGQFDPRLKGYQLPEGFRLEVVLTDPDVVNPVGMTFAPDGTLFVMEWQPDPVNMGWFEVRETFRYRDGTSRQVATMKKFAMDVVKQFKVNPATGKFGKAQPIISEELPSSILWHDGWLYVSGRGTVRRYKQATPVNTAGQLIRPPSAADPWAIREVIAQGFCGFHHHQVSGLTIGNDGLLYITSGDDDNRPEGSDGSRATVLRTGAVFRCRPDGSRLETYSLGYRNPYRDLSHDDKFNWFHVDNDNEDGSRFMGCRLMHVVEGADFGWRLLTGARCCRPDHARGAVGGERPGMLPPMLKTGRGSPAGLCIYHDTRLPEAYRGLLFYPDVYRKVVRAYKTAPDGSTFKVGGEFEFLKSDDPLFRPCQMVTGPDGAIYVCDWRTDSGGAGKLWGDGVHGRVYRIRWAGTDSSPALPLRGMNSWAGLLKLSDAELVDKLGADDFSDRLVARNELVRRGPAGRDLVLNRFRTNDVTAKAVLPAMGVLMGHWNADVADLFRTLLRHGSGDVRRQAADGLGVFAGGTDPASFEPLVKALADANLGVRRSAALALPRVGGAAADALLTAWRSDADADAFLKDAYLRGLELTGKAGVNALLALAASGEKDIRPTVEAFVALRTRPAADALPELLGNPHLSAADRDALVRSYANYQLDPPISLDPLVTYLANNPKLPPTVVQAGLETLTLCNAVGPTARELVLRLMTNADRDVRLAALKAVEDGRFAEAAPALVNTAGRSDVGIPERVAAVRALRGMKAGDAVEPARTLLLTTGVPGAVRMEALRTLNALEPMTARAEAPLLLDQPDPALVKEAAAVLGATKPGAKLLGDRYLEGKLPRDLFPQVSAALKEFDTDPAVAKLRAAVMRGGLMLSTQPGEVEKIRLLVAVKGNPSRGKELYLNTKLLACSTCHAMEGLGGAVGPDLTRLWDTHSIEKLVESMVEPSKEIKEGYQTYRAVTTADQVVTGLKVSDTPAGVTIRDATGRDVVIPRDELSEVAPTKLSLMPDDAVSRLTFDQFIDLLAFLKNREEQESFRRLPKASAGK